MIIPYELSLWIDYPGEQGIEEEKKSIIAASDQNLAGRAQNIKLKLSYTGQHTLTFEIPVKYFDIYKGEDVLNPLIEQVHVKSKIKLWRDEKWWNAFGGTQTEGDNGETIFSGAWEQGRWYEFVIKNRSEKRAKKQLIYTYEATEAFVNELSRTGYNLEFTKEDIMSINGMGTVHTLTERVLEGTDWKYIKTESFPDYKEEFSVETGEVIKTPIKTDEIELLNTEKRYGYLYDVSYNENDLVMKAFEQGDVLDYYKDWDPVSGKIFWYKNAQDKAVGKYTTDVYGYDKTEIITSYADRLLVEDSGVMCDSEKGNYVRTVNANLMNTTNAWEIDDKKNILGLASTIEELENKASILKYNITLKNNVNPKEYAYIKNRSFERTPLNQGDIILVKFSVVGASSDKLAFMIQDSSNNNLVIGHEIKFSNTDYLEDQFKHTYAITVPSYIKNPVVFIGVKGESVAFQQVYIYRLKGYDEFLNKTLQSAIFLNNINGLIAMADLEITEVLQEGYRNIDLNQNTIEAPDGTTQNIWLPFGKIVQNDYQDTKVVYCIEVFDKGEYKIAYLPTPTSSVKRSSYKNDKRRAIEISKSNRFSIIQEISKTFYAFSRFMVEHDKNGYIKKDVAGRPKKYITMVSQLGRTNANGFNYGVNIDTIERKLNGEQLVTKMYVEDKDNEYDKNGLMTIVDSKYNLLGERYIYNFNYYLNRGIINKDQFLADYEQMFKIVSRNNTTLLTTNENILNYRDVISELETNNSVYKMIQSSLSDEANKKLQSIRFPSIQEQDGYNINLTPFPSFSLRVRDSSEEEWYSVEPDEWAERYDMLPGPITMQNTGIQSSSLAGIGKEKIKECIAVVEQYQTAYLNYVGKIEKNNQNIEEIRPKLEEEENKYTKLMTQKQRATSQFENKYILYITEGTWGADGYIDSNLYYADATRALTVAAMPKVEYSLTGNDLSKLTSPIDLEDETWGESFIYDVGDTTYVKDTELFANLEQTIMIAEREINVDVVKPDTISLRNYETRFDDLFQSIAATVTSVSLNENIYSRAENFNPTGTLKVDALQRSVTNNKNLVIQASNDNVEWNKMGITVIDNDRPTDMVRIISKGIFLSTDGGSTYVTGITPNGINANIVTTGELNTEKVIIRNGAVPNFIWDAYGINAYTNMNAGNASDSSFIRFDQFGIYCVPHGEEKFYERDWYYTKTYDDAISDIIQKRTLFSLTKKGITISIYSPTSQTYKRVFDADDAGNLSIEGKITALTGSIAGWDIQPTYLGNLGTKPKDCLDAYFISGQGRMPNTVDMSGPGKDKLIVPLVNDNNEPNYCYIFINNKFAVTTEGKLYAKNVALEGINFSDNTIIPSSSGGEEQTVKYFNGFLDNLKSVGSINKTQNDFFGLLLEDVIPTSVGYGSYLRLGGLGPSSEEKLGYSYVLETMTMTPNRENNPNGLLIRPRRSNYNDANVIDFAILCSESGYTSSISDVYSMLSMSETDGVVIKANLNSQGGDLRLGSFIIDGDGVVLYSSYGKLQGSWTSNSFVANNSDYNLKNDIVDIPISFSTFFDNLRPCLFKYNDGTSNRHHVGFIAQEVKKALDVAQISTQEFGGLIIANKGTEKEQWALRYEEFIALNTIEIQTLKTRVYELEQQLKSLTKY